MEKRISNKLSYTLIVIFSIILLGVGVYSYAAGSAEVAGGHSIAEIEGWSVSGTGNNANYEFSTPYVDYDQDYGHDIKFTAGNGFDRGGDIVLSPGDGASYGGDVIVKQGYDLCLGSDCRESWPSGSSGLNTFQEQVSGGGSGSKTSSLNLFNSLASEIPNINDQVYVNGWIMLEYGVDLNGNLVSGVSHQFVYMTPLFASRETTYSGSDIITFYGPVFRYEGTNGIDGVISVEGSSITTSSLFDDGSWSTKSSNRARMISANLQWS